MSGQTSTLVERKWVLADEAATLRFGGALAPLLSPGDVIFLHGDLGAGKTTLARGILRGLGVQGRVKSPTYALVEVYVLSRLNLYHFDFYRMSDPEEWHEAGFRDFFNQASICLVEWPERASGSGVSLPQPTLEMFLEPLVADSAPTQRQLTVCCQQTTASSRLNALASRWNDEPTI